LCREEDIAILPWSPLARGRLTRPWRSASTLRFETDGFGRSMYAGTEQIDRAVVERLGEVAQRRGVPHARLALSWLLAKPGVTAPIVGATQPHHLEDAVAALSITLDREEIAALEEPYRPHPVLGFR
jgi:aryl-alcohol dehydrogenase-like predicted oxidoreductase